MFSFSQYALKLSKRTGSQPVHRFFRCKSTSAVAGVATAGATPALQITLRTYQEDCIQSVLSSLEKGHRRLGISLATGSGKTVIFTQLINRIPSANDAEQTLILAHRRELVEQAARHCILAYPSKSIDVEMGASHASGAADITVASIQSINSGDRILKFDPSRYKLILVDEAHHIVSSQYLDVLEHFGLRHAADWTQTSAPALVGVSATFSRFDGKSLGSAIDHIVYHRDYVDMIEENWLSDVSFTTVESKADISRISSGATGDFQPGALSQAVNTDETNEITVRAWLARAKARKSTLVFCVDLSHVSSLTSTFRKYGFDARFVTGDTPKKVRSERVDAFKNGEFPVLLNCGVFTEGTDIPNIDCVLLARPTKSRNLLVQMIGRGMRLHKGKQNCHIIDMVASLNAGIVSTPTLFGLDPAEIVEDLGTKDMMELRERKEKEQQREQEALQSQTSNVAKRVPGRVTFTDYDSVYDLIQDTSEERFIRAISPYAWVGVGDGKYILTTRTGSYISLEPDGSRCIVKFTQKLPEGIRSKSPFATPRIIAQTDSFEHAVHSADTYAAKVFEYIFISKSQAWRRKPASQAQVDFLNKMRSKDNHLTTSTITKGQAGDMITKTKHGTKGRFEKMSAQKRLAQRSQEKMQLSQMQTRDQIKVGPLSRDS
ncbi:P-loop containing nucleoside triphosphate hydrolase protein [Lophium mytilinum]|uniref:P-loop containing nucleoside triphosphate hydrolase protein n=1 Tax=Lophium mytilinum TaxID=390894 RepID=A0A6A6RFI7_9PEZI|nr:P-loop containing nucleoside triphosphate hydrolase protein [Lophium mytilinum]